MRYLITLLAALAVSGGVSAESVLTGTLPRQAEVGFRTSSSDAGLAVTNLAADSSAARAGLRDGDVIRSVNDTSFSKPYEGEDLLRRFDGDVLVQLNVLRDGGASTGARSMLCTSRLSGSLIEPVLATEVMEALVGGGSGLRVPLLVGELQVGDPGAVGQRAERRTYMMPIPGHHDRCDETPTGQSVSAYALGAAEPKAQAANGISRFTRADSDLQL